jgi:hypothetical protein
MPAISPGVVPLQTRGPYRVLYQEEEGYGEMWAVGNVEVTRVLRCRWDQRAEFVQDMVGAHTWDGTSTKFERDLPEADLTYDFLSCVSCRLREAKGVPCQDASDGALEYIEKNSSGLVGTTSGYAVYDCVFRALDYNLVVDAATTSELQRFVTRDWKFAVDALVIPSQSLRWSNTGEDGDSGYSGTNRIIAQPLPKNFPTANYQMVWEHVPGLVVGAVPVLPIGNILDALGTVNNADFDAGFGPSGATKVFPAGTLLVLSAEAIRVRTASAQPLWRITYSCHYRGNKVGSTYKGWNSLYDRISCLFLKVFATVAGKPAIYDTSDFTKLFKFT